MPQHFGVNDILDGFWLNEQFKWTCGGDCQYRIPPSQILLITKEDFPDNT